MEHTTPQAPAVTPRRTGWLLRGCLSVGGALLVLLLALVLGLYGYRWFQASCRGGPCVRTLAGGTTPGYRDGPAAQARFANPRGVTVALDGTVYVADTGNQRIRRIEPNGQVSTVAGTGTAGYQDGPAASAQFNGPTALAVDAAGTLYVADSKNQRVRKITPAGQVSTVLGPPDVAQPTSVALDAAGTLYVGDSDPPSYGGRIRTVRPDGVVTVLPGAEQLVPPEGGVPALVALDSAGNVYTVVSVEGHDPARSRPGDTEVRGTAVVVLRPGGRVVTLPVDLALPADRDPALGGLAVSGDGTVYLSVGSALEAFRLTPDGTRLQRVRTVGSLEYGGYQGGSSGAARFSYLEGIAVDGAGNVYLTDTEVQDRSVHTNSCVRKFSLRG